MACAREHAREVGLTGQFAALDEHLTGFLDEPTTGLDPRSRRQVWELVRDLDATVLLTTQYLEEADQLADRIAIIGGGRVVAEGTPAELKAFAGRERLDDAYLELTA
jgi:ABC-2 type transport system ATP-binding protein